MAKSSQKISIPVQQSIYYSNKQHLSIKEIASALLASEQMYLDLKPTLKALFSESDIIDITVGLVSVESGSYLEELSIDFVFGGPDGYEKFRKSIRKISGRITKDEDINLTDEEKKVLTRVLSLVFAAALGYGAYWAIDSSSDVKQPTNHIELHNSTINNIVIGDGEGKVTGEQIVALIHEKSDQKSMAKAAVEIIKPAKKDPTASISINEQDDLMLKPEVIKEVPKKYVPPQPDEKIETYSNVPIFVIASDAQKKRVGWACIVPNIEDNRVKMTLTEDIDPQKLHGFVNIMADISIIKKLNKETNQYVTQEVLVKSWEIAN